MKCCLPPSGSAPTSPKRYRSLITCAALVTTGKTEHELSLSARDRERRHTGAHRDDHSLAFYVGWPVRCPQSKTKELFGASTR
jgi:hypothetical protein